MQMKTIELEIPKEFMEPEWQTNKIKIRKWNLSIRNEILDQSTEMKSTGGTTVSTKLQGGFNQILTLAKCVTEAPWRIGDTTTVGELDPRFGDWVYNKIHEFNGGGLKNPQDLAESSEVISEEPEKNKK